MAPEAYAEALGLHRAELEARGVPCGELTSVLWSAPGLAGEEVARAEAAVAAPGGSEDPRALYYLAWLTACLELEADEEAPALARQRYERAARAGSSAALLALSHRTELTTEAEELWRRAAEAGEPEAMADRWERLRGVGRHDEARAWLERAAAGGLRWAMRALADELLADAPTPAAVEEALDLLRRAARRGGSTANLERRLLERPELRRPGDP